MYYKLPILKRPTGAYIWLWARPGNSRIIKCIILGLLALIFLMFAYQSHISNQNYNRIDQDSYLLNVIELNNQGGPTKFLYLCFTGSYKQAAQHPLYIWLCSFFSGSGTQLFTKIKFLSTLLSLIFYLVFFVLVKKQYGFLTSAICISILVTSNEFIRYMSWVACEYLLITFTLLTWYFTTNGFTDQKLWIWGGLSNGFAYMSKPTAFFFLPVFVISYFIMNFKNRSLKESLKNKYFYLYFLAFIFVSSPLLTRNIIVYKSPLYNWNQKIMWMDYHAFTNKAGMNSQNPTKPVDSNISTYFKTHSVKMIFNRLALGCKKQFSVLLNSLGGFGFIASFPGYYIFNTIIYSIMWIIAFIFILKDECSACRVYNFILFSVFYLSISFLTPVLGKHYRFFMPIASIFIIYAGIGLKNILAAVSEKLKLSGTSPNALGLIMLTVILSFICLKVFIISDFSKNPFDLNGVHTKDSLLIGTN